MAADDDTLRMIEHRLATLEKALTAKGILTPQELAVAPPEYQFLANWINTTINPEDTDE